MFARVLVGVILATAVQSAVAATAPVGATPGTFTVDQDGQPNYKISIVVAPGTADMVPKISLTYTAAVENPLAGLGFSISGLSIINRCGRTIALDGTKGGVSYDGNDRFCLDGQRLVAINGAYGANSTEYRTERESFSKIISYRDSSFTGNGPQYFRVTTKDGMIMEYGVTADSRIEAAPKNNVAQTTVRLWAVNKVQNAKGNYYTVTYNENNTNGEYSPARIDYTGNANASPVVTPYNSIRFNYSTRTDVIPKFQAGSVQKVTQRLTSIVSYANDTSCGSSSCPINPAPSSGAQIVRSYNLSYDTNGTSDRSRLVSIQECGSDAVCLPATTFGWHTGTTGFVDRLAFAQGAYGNWVGNESRIRHTDVNGDGQQDIVLGPDGSGGWYVLRSTGSGFVDDGPWISGVYSNWVGNEPRIRVVDVNGDGLQDVVLGPDGSGGWYVLRSTGTSFVNDGAWISGVYSNWTDKPNRIRAMDVNGDGRQDIVLGPDDSGGWYVLRSTGTGFVNDGAWITGAYGNWTDNLSRIRAMDVNGDGMQDIVFGPDTTGGWYALRSTGSSFVDDGAWVTGAYGNWEDKSNRMRVIDVNGDGLEDIVIGPDGSGGWYVLRSTGKSFVNDGPWISNVYTNWEDKAERIRVTDINGDGLQDIVLGPDNSGGWYVLRSTGTNFINDGAWITGVYANWFDLHARIHVMDANGDGFIDIVMGPDSSGGWYRLEPREASPKFRDKLASITNGLSAVINIEYKSLSDTTVYTKGSGADLARGYMDVQNATHVVSRVTQSDGLGSQYATNYKYAGAKAHLRSRGWLGFSKVEVTDERNGITTSTEYDVGNGSYEAGLAGVATVTETKLGTVVLKRLTNFWSGVEIRDARQIVMSDGTINKFARPDGSLDESFELDGNPVTCAQTNNTFSSFDAAGNYGNYGKPSTVNVSTDVSCSFLSPFVKTTTNNYSHDTTNWILGLIVRTRVESQAPGQSAIVRTSGFSFDSSGWLTQETIEPDLPAGSVLRMATTHAPDAFGNRITTTVSGANPNGSAFSRQSSTSYNARGQFALSTTNALGHTTSSTYDPRWSTPLTQTDVNGLTTSFEYDGFGRKATETKSDGTQTVITYRVCDTVSCAPVGTLAPKYSVTTQPTAASPTKVYYDVLNRSVRNESTSLTGRTVYQDMEYDSLGRVTRKSHAYFSSDAARWDASTYDAFDRVTVATDSDGRITTTSYQGLTSTVTGTVAPWVTPQINSRWRTTVKNAKSKNISVVDSLYPNNPTTFQYDAVDQVTRVTDPLGNVTSLAYDIRGRKVSLSDPNMGTWTYDYNSVSELTSQTDAKNQTQTTTYDDLGRLKTRTTSEGLSAWVYDTANKGVGKLASLSGPNCAQNPNCYRESYNYDNLGRDSTKTVIVDGESYVTTTAYYQTGDADTNTGNLGKVRTVTYPTGFAVKSIYNSNGYLTEVRNAQTNARYWQALDADALGRLTRERANGELVITERVYDQDKDTLNSIRTTGPSGLIQDIEYTFDVRSNLMSRADRILGLTETFSYDTLNRLTAVVSGPAPKTFGYNEIGNIVYKSDVGTYSYGAKPNAVTATSGILSNTYTYDANGSMLGGAGRTFTYTSFNKPAQVSAAGVSTSLSYGPNFNRVKKANANATTIYVDALYQRITQGAVVEHKHYISSSAGIVAVHTSKNDNSSNTRYLHGDHLNSTDTITDEAGGVISGGRLSFDAHGKRRNSNWTDAASPIAVSEPTTNGFTGHEMDDESGLINMKARLYDPVLGRFISSDSIVEASFGQGLNRYTYAHNSPLSLTDPSGFDAEGGGGSEGYGGNDFSWNWNWGFDTWSSNNSNYNFGWQNFYTKLDTGARESAWFSYANPERTGNIFMDSIFSVASNTRNGLAYAGNSFATLFNMPSIFWSAYSDRTLKQAEQDLFVAGMSVGPIGAFALSSRYTVSFLGNQYGRMFRSAENVLDSASTTRTYNAYEVLAEVPISGASRSAHRASANAYTANQLRNDADYADMLRQQLGTDVLQHMQSGRSLLNPPGTVWHHPVGNPSAMQLLRSVEHTDPMLQPLLHPGGIGGYGTYYGY